MFVMVAAVNARLGELCVVYRTERSGLRVITTSYCSVVVSAGDGVLQVPKEKITCEHCKASIKEMHGVSFDD